MKRIHALTAMAASLVMSTGAMAQQSSHEVAGQVSVTILPHDNITLTQVEALRFGTLLPYGRDGYIVYHPNGSTSASNLLPTSDGGPSSWIVQGTSSAPFSIAFPAATQVVDGVGNTMTVNGFSRSGATNMILNAAGEASFTIGAVLRVGAIQPAGDYNGSYQVTVAYN